MTATDPALTALADGWWSLSQPHGTIETRIERALQAHHDLSVREFSLLNVLSRQHSGEGGHLQMNQVAVAVVLSQSATTRLVSRLEDRDLLARYLCPTDRRGIYTDVTEQGRALLERSSPRPMTAPCGLRWTTPRRTPSSHRWCARSKSSRRSRRRSCFRLTLSPDSGLS
ncbi:MarR family winged helix-turn-helix transcriptional regulator [Aeromicrobium sp. UC242_57]|uniref:MarR family winged helix-turn-helix transcriptional regulator n=1 Tax=Aeromicrobium sp. UC242_57 TaxID=3374624 RepID=UPI0037907885